MLGEIKTGKTFSRTDTYSFNSEQLTTRPGFRTFKIILLYSMVHSFFYKNIFYMIRISKFVKF